jgi:hypothetical protein
MTTPNSQQPTSILSNLRPKFDFQRLKSKVNNHAVPQKLTSFIEENQPYILAAGLLLAADIWLVEDDFQFTFRVLVSFLMLHQIGNYLNQNRQNIREAQRDAQKLQDKIELANKTAQRKHKLAKERITFESRVKKQRFQTPSSPQSPQVTHDPVSFAGQANVLYQKQILQLIFMAMVLFSGLALSFFGSMFALSLFSAASGLFLIVCQRIDNNIKVKRSEFAYLFLLVLLSIGSQFCLPTFATGIILDHMYILLCFLLSSISINVEAAASSNFIFLFGLLSSGSPMILSFLFQSSWLPAIMPGMPIMVMVVLTCLNALCFMFCMSSHEKSVLDQPTTSDEFKRVESKRSEWIEPIKLFAPELSIEEDGYDSESESSVTAA